MAKFDYLFHKTGPLKGKPRGYAFVEYASAEVCRLHSTFIIGSHVIVECYESLAGM